MPSRTRPGACDRERIAVSTERTGGARPRWAPTGPSTRARAAARRPDGAACELWDLERGAEQRLAVERQPSAHRRPARPGEYSGAREPLVLDAPS